MRPGPPATACPWGAARLLEKKRRGNKKEKHTMFYPPEPPPTHTDTHRHVQIYTLQADGGGEREGRQREWVRENERA